MHLNFIIRVEPKIPGRLVHSLSPGERSELLLSADNKLVCFCHVVVTFSQQRVVAVHVLFDPPVLKCCADNAAHITGTPTLQLSSPHL